MAVQQQDSAESSSQGESTERKPRGPKKPRTELSIIQSMGNLLGLLETPEAKRRALAYLTDAANQQLREREKQEQENYVRKAAQAAAERQINSAVGPVF